MPLTTPAWEVMPLLPLSPRARHAYPYRAAPAQSVTTGVLVRVPFGRRTVDGLIIRAVPRSRRQTSQPPLKTLAAVLSSAPLFARAELDFLETLAQRSLESLPLLVSAAVLVRRPLARLPAPALVPPHRKGPTATGAPVVLWKELADALPSAPDGQVLVLAPELSIARAALSVLTARGVPAVVFAQTLPQRERRETLDRLRHGEALVVVATHAGIFLPLPALSKILVAETALPSHRQWDRHPRYDARVAAVLLQNSRRVPLTLQSTLPSLDLVRLAGGTAPPGTPRTPPFQLVRRSHADTYFLPETVAALRASVTNRESLLIFHDTAGDERAFTCGTCGLSLRCDRCDMPTERSDGILRCRSCKSRQGTVPRFCPRCRSPHIGPRRVGTVAIAETVQRMFPDVPVLRLDRDTARQRNVRLSPAWPPTPSITIATERAFALLPAPAVDRVIVLHADHLLEDASYDAAERFVVTMSRLRSLPRRPIAILLQTTHPRLAVVQALVAGTLGSWIADELSDRQALAYPPFAGAALLEKSFSSLPAATRAVLRARAHVAQQCPDCPAGSRVVRGKVFRAEILLRGSPDALRAATAGLLPGWSVDPDIPLSCILAP